MHSILNDVELFVLNWSTLSSPDQNIIQIPLAVVILGSIACVILMLDLLIILSKRTLGKIPALLMIVHELKQWDEYF